MARKEKPMLVGAPHLLTIGGLLRRLRHERGLSLSDLASLMFCNKGHLSNIEAGKHTKISNAVLVSYEKLLGFKPHEIGAFFLLLRAEIIPIDSLFTDISPVDLSRAVEITQVLDSFPQLLESVAVFIKQNGCGLSGYLETYHPLVVYDLSQYRRPSVVEFKLRTLLQNQSERDS